MTMLQHETGFTAVVLIDDGGEYRLPLEHFTRVRQEWMQGVAFLDVVDYFGAPITIKTSRIEAIAQYPAAVLAARGAHDAEVRKADAFRSDL